MYFICILYYFTGFLQNGTNETHTIYIAKIDWHVGIILSADEYAKTRIEALEDFTNFNFVDIGWGDSAFYQSTGDFDLYLASKAILYPTNSVVRIRGYNYEIEQILEWRDFVFELSLTEIQFNLLCKFIDKSFARNEENQLVIESEQLNGTIKFYSSIHKYHLFNTCNSWVAEALEAAETEIESSNVVTAEELFEELLKFAHLLKFNQDSL